MAGTRRVIIRLCAAPVDSRSSPSRSRYPARSSLARAAASGVNSSRTRPIASSWSPPGAVMPSVRRRGAGTDAARLPGVTGQLREPLDVTLALDPRRVVRRQTVDQATDPVADLEREVRGGGPRERADVLHGDPMVGSHAIGALGFAHRRSQVVALMVSSAWTAPASLAGRRFSCWCRNLPAPPPRG